ncbi:MAG: B12-binding domain-containing radical SAM protein [Promethearchaeota archaeon]
MTMKYTDILFICPAGGDLYDTAFRYTLGSAYIIAYLRNNGYMAHQFISKKSFNIEECTREILKFKPKVIGFTVYNSNYMQCVLLSRGLKRINPKIITIFGGPTPTVQSEDILECESSVDICVRGEGEEVSFKLLNSLKANDHNLQKTNLEKIWGITFRRKNAVITNPDSDILSSNKSVKYYIDKYPSPYLSDVISASQAFPLGIITARGCNQNCVYCNCAIMNKRNIYFHSTNRVIGELSYIKENRSSKFPIPINDDGFTIIPSRAKEICEKIIEYPLDIPLACITRADKIDKELLDLMKQASFKSIGFSLESAVPKVLRSIGKVNPPDKKDNMNYEREKFYIRNLQDMTVYAKKIGMHPVFVSIMVGLPGETYPDALKTLKLVKKLDIDYYAHNNLHIYKGTPIFQNHSKYNYIIKNIGKRNPIFTKNSYPYDVNKIKLGKNSAERQTRKNEDYKSLKILSGNLDTEKCRNFFNNIIINSNIIKENLIKWLHDNLALNGSIIQIYSSKKKFKEWDDKNMEIFCDTLAPTKYYKKYYWEKKKGSMLLKSERMPNYGDDVGMIIKFIDSTSALKQYNKTNKKVENLICVENSIKDTSSLLGFLEKITEIDDPFNYLLEKKPLPQIMNICRWTNTPANCQTLDTAIIDQDNIKICWFSDPIAKVGVPFSKIKENIEKIHLNTIFKRQCKKCVRFSDCNKCYFTYPISDDEYCNFQKGNNMSIATNLINSLNLLKDLVFEPTSILDY